MYPVSFKKSLKKIRHYYKKGKCVATTLKNAADTQSSSEAYTMVSTEKGGDIELPMLPSSYFDSQKGLGEWVERAETFSTTSKIRFQQ